MQILVRCPCIISNSSFFNPSVTLINPSTSTSSFPLAIPPKPYSNSCKSLCFSSKISKFRRTLVTLCNKSGAFEEFKDTLLPKSSENEEAEELELLNKPLPKQATNGSVVEIEETELKKPDKDEILKPFYKFMKSIEEENGLEAGNQGSIEEEHDYGNKTVSVEYYEPKPRDLVVGVVVSGSENKLDVNVGAKMLGTMLTKEILPLTGENSHLLYDVGKDAEEFLGRGKVGIVRNDEAMHVGPMQGKPVVEPGIVILAEVLGRALSGRPVLSSRRLFRRLAWHRVRLCNSTN